MMKPHRFHFVCKLPFVLPFLFLALTFHNSGLAQTPTTIKGNDTVLGNDLVTAAGNGNVEKINLLIKNIR